MANITEVSKARIRVYATILQEDIQRFRLAYRAMVESAANSVDISQQLVSNSQATQAGQQAGQNIAQGAQGAVSSQAGQVVAPIAQQGSSIGSQLGTALVAGVLAKIAAARIGKGFGQAMENEAAGGKLTAQLGLTPEQSKKYGALQAKIYGQAFGESLDDVGSAIASVITSVPGMANASDEAIESMSKKLLTLSDAFELDVGRSSQVLGQLVRNGVVKDVDEGTDLLTATLQKVPANLREDVVDALDEYGPFFAQMGIKGQDAFNLLLKSSEKGMYGIDKAGDAVKEFSIRSTDMSKASVDAYTAIGLNAQDMTNKILAGGPQAKEAFQQVIAGLQGIEDPATRANTAIALFGTPLEDLGVSEIPAFLDQLNGTVDTLGDVTGAADEAGEALGNTMESQLEGLRRQFSQTLAEIALPLLEAILPVVQAISSFLTENKDAVVAIGGPLLVIGGVIAAIVAAISVYSTIMSVLGPALVAVGAAQFTWNAALFANPITIWILAIAAVIALIALLIINFETVQNWIASIINGILQLINLLPNFLGGIGSVLGVSFGGFSVGAPMMAQGGLVPATPGGSLRILGEGGKNEIVYNEDVYNKREEATTKMINNINNGSAGTGGGDTKIQNNYFTRTDPNAVEAVLVNRANRMPA